MAVAYPFVKVETGELPPPIAQRAPGVLAIVGASDKGTAAVNLPMVVGSVAEAAAFFAEVNAAGAVTASTPLYEALKIAMQQSPGPSKLYGVKVGGAGFADALSSVAAADDVTFVAIAGKVAVEPAGGQAAAEASPELKLLLDHINEAESEGNKRMGVLAIDPTIAKSNDYDDVAESAVIDFRSKRIIAIAARGATQGGATPDVASAAAAAIAGLPPAASIVLKRLRGFRIPLDQQYSPTEIRKLAEKKFVPVIDPALIVGEGLHFAEGLSYAADIQYVDVVRLLDDIEFKLKAGLIGMIGDARITQTGLNSVQLRAAGILDRNLGPGGIDAYQIIIPVLEILRTPRAGWSEAQRQTVEEARANRVVPMFVSITLGPAVHTLDIKLQPSFT